MTNDYLQIILFSGTTEGRELSGILSAAGICHTVCVATEYGHTMQGEDAFAQVHEGRLDAEGMQQLFAPHSVVVDATHPFAFEVTANIRAAAEAKGLKYIRVLRPAEAEEQSDGCTVFRTMDQCARALNGVEGNILFTTGSKELEKICAVVQDHERLYARVLPTAQSIALCEQAGIRSNHIIALHGPFSLELNEALLRQYNIRCLVTRDSGKAGGFEEKRDAALNLGIACYVIRRPDETEGLSVEEAFEVLCKPRPVPDSKPLRQLTVSIVGIGMGNPQGLTLAAGEAIRRAEVLYGAERLLKPWPAKEQSALYLARDILPALQEKLNEKAKLNAAVLFSGDIGFYSGAAAFEKALFAWAETQPDLELKLQRFPGISSVAALAAKLGVSWSEAVILSLHGRNAPEQVHEAALKLSGAENGFVLLSSGADLAALANEMNALGADASYTVASRLSYPDEEICKLNAAEAAAFSGKGLFTVYVRRYANG